jgi:hypothetical protein
VPASLAALLWLFSIGPGPAAGSRLPIPAERALDNISATEILKNVGTLAADEFAGRGLGQPGNLRAERYVADALRAAGVTPAAGDAYLHRIEIYTSTLGGDGRLTVTSHGRGPSLDLRVGPDFYPLPSSGTLAATGRLLYAGHGLSLPELGHDDYAGVNVRGAIVLVLDDVPAQLAPRANEAERMDLASVRRKKADAAARGAVGLVVIKSTMAPLAAVWPEPSARPSPAYQLHTDTASAQLPVAAISTNMAATLRRALDDGAVLDARLAPGVVSHTVPAHNVLGMVEGWDPARAEMIVIGAHLDHQGVDDEGRIYNGADDNASGTAAVLAIATAFTRAAVEGHRPFRAVVFALWNAEEEGSLGAEAFVASPQPHRRIVANINLDMVGRAESVPEGDDPRFRGFSVTRPGANVNVVHLLGYSYAPALAYLVAAANDATRLTIKQDYDRNAQNLLQRSDHWPFLKRGIPAVFLTTGLHPDYHTPEDDTPRIDFEKLVRIAKLAGRAGWLAAESGAPAARER